MGFTLSLITVVISTMRTYHTMPLTASSINIKEDDNNIGPPIRHPSGEVCLDILYLREKNDKSGLSSAAKLYQTIIGYALSKDKTQGSAFKGNDIAYWVLAITKITLTIIEALSFRRVVKNREF